MKLTVERRVGDLRMMSESQTPEQLARWHRQFVVVFHYLRKPPTHHVPKRQKSHNNNVVRTSVVLADLNQLI